MALRSSRSNLSLASWRDEVNCTNSSEAWEPSRRCRHNENSKPSVKKLIAMRIQISMLLSMCECRLIQCLIKQVTYREVTWFRGVSALPEAKKETKLSAASCAMAKRVLTVELAM